MPDAVVAVPPVTAAAGGAGAPPPATPAPAVTPAVVTPPVELAKTPPPAEYKFKLPEQTHMDQAAVDAFTALAKEKNWTPEQAQMILERDHSERASLMKSSQDAMAAEDARWKTELSGDKEFGGEKFGENSELVKRAFDYADPDGSFRKALDAAKLSNNPQLVKFVWKFGKMMAEDKLSAKASGQPTPKRAVEESLYPSMFKKA